MLDETKILTEPIRYGCRICRGDTQGTSTVCDLCRDKVFRATGGEEDRHVRQYISERNRMAESDTNREPRDLRAHKAIKPATVLSHRRQRCTCGELYSREIAVSACEARGHRKPGSAV